MGQSAHQDLVDLGQQRLPTNDNRLSTFRLVLIQHRTQQNLRRRKEEEEGRVEEEGRCQLKVFSLQKRQPLEAELPYLPGHPEEQEGRSFWRYACY